jgi:hypothetical protein
VKRADAGPDLKAAARHSRETRDEVATLTDGGLLSALDDAHRYPDSPTYRDVARMARNEARRRGFTVITPGDDGGSHVLFRALARGNA